MSGRVRAVVAKLGYLAVGVAVPAALIAALFGSTSHLVEDVHAVLTAPAQSRPAPRPGAPQIAPGQAVVRHIGREATERPSLATRPGHG